MRRQRMKATDQRESSVVFVFTPGLTRSRRSLLPRLHKNRFCGCTV